MLGVARAQARQLCRAASACSRLASTVEGSTSVSGYAASMHVSSFGSSLRGLAALQSRGAATEAKASGKGKKGRESSSEAADASSSLVVKESIKDAKAADVGKFIVFTEEDAAKLLPEGCPAFAKEFDDSASRRLLLRDAFFRLQKRIVGDSSPAAADAKIATPATVLTGDPGSGKSALVAMAVAWARAHGWLALYVPKGHLLTERSQFSHHEPSGMLDTGDHAREILAALSHAHGPLLAELPRQAPGAPAGEALAALVKHGLAPTANHAAAVEAALAMIDELRLCTKVPVLIAVDELNALSGWSEYHVVAGPKSRRRLRAGQLRVAAAVRDATKPLARGAFLGATTSTGGLSPRLKLEACRGEAKRAVEGFSQGEAEAMLRHYAHGGLLQVDTEEEIVETATQLRVLSDGSGEVLRRNVVAPTVGGLSGRVGRRVYM